MFILMFSKFLFCFLIGLTTISFATGHVFDEQIFLEHLKDNPVIEELYYPYLNKTINLIDYLITDSKSTINDQCASNLYQIKNGLLMKERWALLYYESNGFPKNGRLNGDYNNLGYFDQCLSIGDREMLAQQSFDTKFCLISISTPEWNQLIQKPNFHYHFNPLQESTKEIYKFNFGKIFGTCLPLNCDTKSILESINRVLLPLGLNATSQQFCNTKTSKFNQPFNFTETIALTIFGCTTTLCLMAYLFKGNSFFDHFSIDKNYSRVYDYNPLDYKIRSTDYLHGLKTTLVAGSILLHCFGILLFQSPFLFSKIRYHHAGKYQIFLDRLFLFADQLFFYGGFFAMFSWYDSIKKINVTAYRYIFTRFIRIFVVSVMVILLTFLMPIISTGPYYQDLMSKCSSNCFKNFWKNLLFINNHDSFMEICFLPTWYLSADFQLYLINYFLLHLLVKKPKIGLILAAVEMSICSLFIIFYDYFKNIPYYYKLTTRMDSTTTFRLEEHYLPTFYHSNTFVMGILTAWLIKSEFKFKFLEKKVNRSLVSALAILSISIGMTLPELWESNVLKKYDLLIIIWSVIDKILVTGSIAWAFYAISLNYYPTLKKFFSLRCWIPIAQISFSMIMCQFLYFFYSTGTQKFPYSFDLSNIMKEFIFAFTITFLISNLTFLFFESPITNLMLKLFNLNRRRDIKLETSTSSTTESNKINYQINISKMNIRKVNINQDELKYDYSEINNNNPDFKPITKMD